MTKIAGSGSNSQRHGSADPDPDPRQNVVDPEHCYKRWNVLWRSTEELHQQRMEQMEELYDSHIQTIKRGIEQKLRNQGELGT
jgi:hypothetical protein